MSDFLGIIGGVGPLASAYFYEMLIQMTEASKDQDHIDMVILNHASIPDRTAFLLQKSEENPYLDLSKDVKTLSKMGASLIFIPCNTSCYFHERLQKETQTPILNMIADTVQFLKKENKKKVMILATTGTIQTKLYQDMCTKENVEYIVPSQEIQNKVMHIIYNNVKSGKKIEQDVWNEIVDSFQNVDACILGCTELSIVKNELALSDFFVDPLEVEAKKILDFFGKKERKRYK